MSRARMVKPSYFTHGDLYDAEEATAPDGGRPLPLRVAYAGLWTVADRAGRFEWKPRELKLKVIPYDPCRMEDVLDALERAEFLRSYVVDGRRYGEVPTLGRHQHFHKKEAGSTLPAPPWEEAAPGVPPADTGAGTGAADDDAEEVGDEHRESTGPAPGSPHAVHRASTPDTDTDSDTDTDAASTNPSSSAAREEREGGEAGAGVLELPSLPVRLAVAANRGVVAAIGEQPRSYVPGHRDTVRLAERVRELGADEVFACAALRGLSEEVTRRERRPARTLAYFLEPLEEAWQEEAVRRAGEAIPDGPPVVSRRAVAGGRRGSAAGAGADTFEAAMRATSYFGGGPGGVGEPVR